MNELMFTVGDGEEGERLDKLISDLEPSLSRSAVQKLIESAGVTLNGKQVKKSDKPNSGDILTVLIPDAVPLTVEAENIPLNIVYEDTDLLVVNKPKGMVVHPAPGNYTGTLVNALLWHCKDSLSGINGVIRPGIVHRIDKDTSGLLIVAKNDTSHTSLAEQIKTHSFKREYRTVVVGSMPKDAGTIDLPIGRSTADRKKQAVNGINPRNAITHYEVVERYPGYTYCKFVLETGRTHQIRVHSAYIGHPVAGDSIYGKAEKNSSLQGQCLHAAVIGFVHPRSGEYLEFESSLPEYFVEFLNKINKP